MSTLHNTHQATVEVSAEVAEASGIGLRILELAAVALVGLLVTPPLLILAVVVVVPTAAVFVLVAALVAAILVPTRLFRRVHSHHQEHGSTLFIHRLGW
jgi:hypothetical protein